MIKPEDLRRGNLVRVNRDCMFPKGAMCVVTDINPLKVFDDKKESSLYMLSTMKTTDLGAFGATMSKAYPSRLKYLTRTVLKKKSLANTIQSLLITRSILLRDFWR